MRPWTETRPCPSARCAGPSPPSTRRRSRPEHEAAPTDGTRGSILRREGLYSSHIVEWRRARDAAVLEGLAQKPRSRTVTPEQAEMAHLRGRAEKAEAELAKARLAKEKHRSSRNGCWPRATRTRSSRVDRHRVQGAGADGGHEGRLRGGGRPRASHRRRLLEVHRRPGHSTRGGPQGSCPRPGRGIGEGVAGDSADHREVQRRRRWRPPSREPGRHDLRSGTVLGAGTYSGVLHVQMPDRWVVGGEFPFNDVAGPQVMGISIWDVGTCRLPLPPAVDDAGRRTDGGRPGHRPLAPGLTERHRSRGLDARRPHGHVP